MDYAFGGMGIAGGSLWLAFRFCFHVVLGSDKGLVVKRGFLGVQAGKS